MHSTPYPDIRRETPPFLSKIPKTKSSTFRPTIRPGWKCSCNWDSPEGQIDRTVQWWREMATFCGGRGRDSPIRSEMYEEAGGRVVEVKGEWEDRVKGRMEVGGGRGRTEVGGGRGELGGGRRKVEEEGDGGGRRGPKGLPCPHTASPWVEPGARLHLSS